MHDYGRRQLVVTTRLQTDRDRQTDRRTRSLNLSHVNLQVYRSFGGTPVW